jgi:glycerate kinase
MQSLHGKAPIGVCAAAREVGIRVVAAVGRARLTASEIEAAGFAACYAVTDLEPDSARSMANAEPLLERLGEQIAAQFLP